jgi:hypothetical protein
MAKKKRSKSSVSDSLPSTTQTVEEMTDNLSAILAHLIIGINPYLDISMVHIMMMDILQTELTDETALEAGQMIAQRARISITEDAPGGVH